jgi:hypothetical protein
VSKPHPFEHAARLIGDPELLLPVFLAGYKLALEHPIEWVKRRLEILTKHPGHTDAIVACMRSIARMEKIDEHFSDNPGKYMRVLPENDSMHKVGYQMLKAATQIVYFTERTSIAHTIMDAICGKADRSNTTIANIVHTELNGQKILPEDLIINMTFSEIAFAVLRSFIRCCQETPTLRVPINLHIKDCEIMWHECVNENFSTPMLRDIMTCFRRMYGKSSVSTAWKSTSYNSPAALYALMIRVTGGGFYIGVPPDETACALDALKKWKIEPVSSGKSWRPGRIGFCVKCLEIDPVREMPNMCFWCGTHTVIFYPLSVYTLCTDKMSYVKKCCIGDHTISSSELASAQLGGGYAICSLHRERHPWIGAMACYAKDYSRMAKTVHQWYTVIAKRASCYATRALKGAK